MQTKEAAPTTGVTSSSVKPVSIPGILEAMGIFEKSKSCEDYFRVIYRSGELQKDVCKRNSAKACQKARSVSLYFTKLVKLPYS